MDKIAESLTTSYRALLLLCAVILLVVYANGTDDLPRKHAYDAVTDMQQDHRRLVEEFADQADDAYGKQLKQAAGSNKHLLAFVEASRFVPGRATFFWSVADRQGKPTGQQGSMVMDLDPKRVSVSQLYQMRLLHSYGAYIPAIEFDQKDLAAKLGKLMRSMGQSGFIEVYAEPDTCLLVARPNPLPADIPEPLGYPVACKQVGNLPPSYHSSGFWRDETLSPETQGELTRRWNLRAVYAAPDLKIMGDREAAAASDEVKIFDLEIKRELFSIIGPFIVVIVILQMLANTSVAARAAKEGLAAEEFKAMKTSPWFGSFNGGARWFMLASLVGVPPFVGFELARQSTPPHYLDELLTRPDHFASIFAAYGLGVAAPAAFAFVCWFWNVRLLQSVPSGRRAAASWGALIMSPFGAAFVALTLHDPWRLMLLVAYTAIGLVAVVAICSPGGAAVSPNGKRVIVSLSVLEAFFLYMASVIILFFKRPDWLMTVMTLIVGIHFLVAAFFTPLPKLGAAGPGALLILLAIAGFFIPASLGIAVPALTALMSGAMVCFDWREKCAQPAAAPPEQGE
jgi:hypothetical protein